jgi:hypothetical protein
MRNVAGMRPPHGSGGSGCGWRPGCAKGPLAHGFAGDQRWTLGRIKTLIGKLFHVGSTVEGTWKLVRRHGWSCQVPVRQAVERGDATVAVWKDQVRPGIKAPCDLGAFICFEDEAGQKLNPPGDAPGPGAGAALW